MVRKYIEEVPSFVEAVPMLRRCVKSQNKLTLIQPPRKILLRVNKMETVWYIMVDASIYGYDVILFAGEVLIFESGDWVSYDIENSSIWIYLEKLVNRLEIGVKYKTAKEVEVYIFTERIVIERCYNKANS